MDHTTNIKGYESLQELANDIGDLRYDALKDFLFYLGQKISNDAQKDLARNRIQLATQLNEIGLKLQICAKDMNSVWKLCRKFMNV